MITYVYRCDYCHVECQKSEPGTLPMSWMVVPTQTDPLGQRTHVCCGLHRDLYLEAYARWWQHREEHIDRALYDYNSVHPLQNFIDQVRVKQ
jgi:hypothetical protein